MSWLFSTVIVLTLIDRCILHSFVNSKSVERCVHIDYRGKDFEQEDSACPDVSICTKTFNISIIHMPPYSEYPLATILRKCCGNCTKVRVVNTFSNLTQVSPQSINSSDFVILFLASSTATTLYGYHFIPVVFAPSVFYITPKHEPILVHLINSCLSLYPLIVICLLMGGIAGFLMWLMETWENREQFPRPFVVGCFEGFWWSFISMTTVGYGDKAPKSIIARLFSILWILIGVAMFGILSALLTAELMKANFPPSPTMNGASVGVLKYREYDASEVAKHGGNIVETNGTDFLSDLFLLIHLLKEKKIDGILLDKYTLRYSITKMLEFYQNGNVTHTRVDIEFFINNTLQTESMSRGERFSYGITVKNTNDYHYFKDTIKDNRLPMETELALDMNRRIRKSKKPELFSPNGMYFRLSLKVIAGILALICCFGVVFEVWRRGTREEPFAHYYTCLNKVNRPVAEKT